MFKVNDYVAYGHLAGACQVIGIRAGLDICGNETEYYVLQPVFDKNIIIKTPINSSQGLMRYIITKEEALALIANMANTETVWINDDRQRNEVFKKALKSGEHVGLVKLIKAVYQEKKAKAAIGKRVRKVDEDAMKVAEKQLHEEIALALDLSPDEVVPYIIQHIS